MHGASDISHSERWPLSHRENACWERKSPMPKERACIPDNWLCISDWQITHRLVFGQCVESEGEKRERHVAGSHIPFLLKKYKALWPHVRCRWKAVFILKQKQTLTQLSTPKHIHPHSWRARTESTVVPDSSSSDLSLSEARRSPRYMFPSKSLYFRLTIHLFLITDLFFCHAGSNADEPT